jgi:hypothetical protein
MSDTPNDAVSKKTVISTKYQFVPVYAMKAYVGVEFLTPVILNFGTEVSRQLHASTALTSRQEPRVPIQHEAVCVTLPIWKLWNEKDFFLLQVLG